MKKLKNKKGFTLIEIIVVLVIMGILLAIAVPSVLGYVNKAKESRYLSDARAAYLGAQSIAVTEKAKGTTDTGIVDQLTAAKINAEVATDVVATTGALCAVTDKTITSCEFNIVGLTGKRVVITANQSAEIVKGALTGGK